MATKRRTTKAGAGGAGRRGGGRTKSGRGKKFTDNSPIIIKGGSVSLFCPKSPPEDPSSTKKWKKIKLPKQPGLGEGITHPKAGGKITRIMVNEVDADGIPIQNLFSKDVETIPYIEIVVVYEFS